MRRYLALGVDGFFTDFPGIGVEVRNALKEKR
jgi:glycerophosphoryl diester phosphodiesterase